MKNLIIVILATIFGVNIALAQKQISIKPNSVYKLDGITFVSPNESGWMLLKSDKLETAFEKRHKNAISNVSVKTVKTKTFETDKDRLSSFEAMKKENLSSLNRDSLHFNYVKFNGLMCLQYDGIFKLNGTTAPKFEYFHTRGYFCPHPMSKGSAIQIETYNYSNTRDFAEDFLSISDEFFKKATFLKQQ